MLPTIQKWLGSGLPFLKTLAAATVWTTADDAAVAWLEKFNSDPDAAIAELRTEGGAIARLGLVRLLGWIENHIHHTQVGDEVLDWLRHLIVDPNSPEADFRG